MTTRKVHHGDLVVREGVHSYDYTEVTGYVHASGSGQVTLPVCTTVGGYVYAYGSGQVTLPVCTTVGGYVHASGSGHVTLPVCTTVGGAVSAYDSAQVTLPRLVSKGDLDAAVRAFAAQGFDWSDGVLSRVLRRRGAVTVVQVVGSAKRSYVVTDGTHTAHGDTLAEARADLRFKQTGRDTSAYKSWTPTTVVSREDAIVAYRAITGACGAGVRQFLLGRKVPSRLPVSRILTETVGQYGHDTFAAFMGAK